MLRKFEKTFCSESAKNPKNKTMCCGAGCAACLGQQLACCVGKQLCSCCPKSSTRSSLTTRFYFALLFLLSAILSYTMLSDWAEQQLSKISLGYFKLQCDSEDKSCFGVIAVYRVCFASSLFHAILSGILYDVKSSKDWRSKIQNQFWFPKLLLLLALTTLTFFIPHGFFVKFVANWLDMPGASIFILIQIILLIDFACQVSEKLVDKWEETENNSFLVFLCVITFGAFGAAVALTGVLYAWFGGGECRLNGFFITFNLLLCFFVSVLSVLPKVQEFNPKSGLTQAAMVSLYTTYLTTSAIANAPSKTCNPLDSQSSGAQTTSVIVGSIFTFLALAYSTSSAATKSIGYSDAESIPLTGGGVEAGDDDENDDEVDGTQYSYSFFHFVFCIGGMYLAMLITNWNSVNVSGEIAVIGKSMSAVWVKIVSSWVVMILYIWTLVAPIIFPDRQF